MGKRINRYLDTCECIISFEWDGKSGDSPHTNPVTINRCSLHSKLTDPTEHRDELYKSDFHRAMTQRKIIELLPEELKVNDGSDFYTFAERPILFYDKNGALRIQIKGLSKKDLEAIQTAINEDESLKKYGDYQIFLD